MKVLLVVFTLAGYLLGVLDAVSFSVGKRVLVWPGVLLLALLTLVLLEGCAEPGVL